MTAFQWGAALQLFGAALAAAAILATSPALGDPLWDIPPGWLPAGQHIGGTVPLPPLSSAPRWAMPADEAEHVADGAGSVRSILDQAADPDLLSDRERQAATDAWITAPVTVHQLDWSAVDAAVARLLAPLDRVEQAHVIVDTIQPPTGSHDWKTSGTVEHTGEIPRILEPAGAAA